MSFSINTVTSDGVETQFPVSFTNGIYDRNNVKVYVQDDVDGTGNPLERSFTWINDGIIELDVAAPTGKTVTLKRVMNKNEPDVNYVNGAILDESNLNQSLDQLLAIQHEILDGAGIEAFNQDVDMNGYRLTNVGQGTQNTDGVNLQQLNAIISAAGTGLIASQREVQTGAQVSSLVTTFTGITYTVSSNNLYVFRNGNYQTRGVDYNETSTSSITWTTVPNATDSLVFITNLATTNSTTDTSAITHTESGTDYNLATYLQNRYVVNVGDYPTVQDALNTGLHVVGNGGTHLVSTPLLFTADGQQLVGVNGFKLQSDGLTSNSPIILIKDLNDTKVLGVEFDCNAETYMAVRATVSAGATVNYSGLEISRCNVSNTYNAVTSLYGGFTVDNLSGASFTYQISGVNIHNNVIDNDTAAHSSHGCLVAYADNVLFADNEILSAGFHGMEAVECTNVIQRDNRVKDCYQSGLGVGTFVKNFTIHDNLIDNCSGDGAITVEHNSVQGVVHNNVITNALNQGINISYGTGGTAPFNEVNDIIVHDNICIADPTSEGKIGINVYSSTGANIGTAVNIKDNILDGFATGIECTWLDFGQVSGNTVRRFGLTSAGRPSKDFMNFIGCTKFSVLGNTCEQEVTTHAITIDTSTVSSSVFTVSDNFIQSATAGALVRKEGNGDLLAYGNMTLGAVNYVSCDGTQSVRVSSNNGPLSGVALSGGSLNGNLESSGTPEGVVTAPVGSTYNRLDGGAGTSFYVKETGSGNTGWVGK